MVSVHLGGGGPGCRGSDWTRICEEINEAMVLFGEKVEEVNRLVEAGISVGGRFEAVLPLSQPGIKVERASIHHG